LNKRYPENIGTFFYMGARAENKFYHFANGDVQYIGDINGTWNLYIEDFYSPDSGYVDSFTLTICDSEKCYDFVSNETNIIINDFGVSPGTPASVYPVTFNVSGIVKTVTGINLTINNYYHTFAGDVGMLLVTPDGTPSIIAGVFGTGELVDNITVTLSSSATTLWDEYSPGVYLNNSTCYGDMFFSSPCPYQYSQYQSTKNLKDLVKYYSRVTQGRLSGESNPRLCVKTYRITGGCETTGSCSTTGITYTTGTSVVEWCSTRGIFDECKDTSYVDGENWVQIDAVFIRDEYLNECDLEYKGGLKEIVKTEYIDSLNNNSVALVTPPITHEEVYAPPTTDVVNITEYWINENKYRKGKLRFYVNGKLFFVVNDFEEIIPRPLNVEKEKQIGVSYNISLGGGTQGLHDNLTLLPIPVCDFVCDVSIDLFLRANINPGSIDVLYTLTSSTPISRNIDLSFSHILNKFDGGFFEIDSSVTIISGATTGQTNVILNEDFTTLNRISSFENISITGVSLTNFVIETESVFPTPTPTQTPTNTPTPTNTINPTQTPTNTPTPTNTINPTQTPTSSTTQTPSITPSPTKFYVENVSFTLTITQHDVDLAINNTDPNLDNSVCYDTYNCETGEIYSTYCYIGPIEPSYFDCPPYCFAYGQSPQLYYYANNVRVTTGLTSTFVVNSVCVPTQTPTKTPTQTPTNTQTPSFTPTNTTTNTQTPSFTPTKTTTPTVTPTQTSSPPPTFSMTFQSPDANPTVAVLPLISAGDYSFTVNWGDGNSDVITTWNDPDATHTYVDNDSYTITIVGGTIRGFSYESASVSLANRANLRSVDSWGNLLISGSSYVLKDCVNLSSFAGGGPALFEVNSLTGFFMGCNDLFNGCTSLTVAPSSLDTTTILDMSSTFEGCTAFNGNVTSWITSGVTSMNSMFKNCSQFNSGIDVWDVSSVINMYEMFYGAQNFNQPIGSWDVSSVTNMQYMFDFAQNFNEDISSWNVSNVSSFVGFMDNTNYSTTNYDLLLNGWSSLPILQYTVTADFDGINYTSTGEDGRNVLINTYGWTVNDGGKI